MSTRAPLPLAEYSIEAFEALITSWGFKALHAAPVLRAFYACDGMRPWEAPDRPVPDALMDRLQVAFETRCAHTAVRQCAEDGTVKLLLRLRDQRSVESVLMPDYRADRAAGCLSSQVGCAMGCDFCATTQTGFERNLTSGEIVEQFLALRSEAAVAGRRLRTVVFMGMGEPLLNFESVVSAVRRIGENGMGGLGWRQITVSTVGIVPGIDALAETGLNVALAVSLHAPDDATRSQLLPTGRKFVIEEILAAADRYQARTGRPVTVQYCLLRGVNDSPDQAKQLAGLLIGRRMHVNLLRYNPTGIGLRGNAYQTSTEEASEGFMNIVRSLGVVAHFRRPRGRDIDAACGQLRRRMVPEAGIEPATKGL